MRPAAYLSLFLLSLGLFSCSDDKICSEKKDAFMEVDFVEISGQTEENVTLPALSVIATKQPDSLLYINANVQKILLPLDPNNTETEFYIQPDTLVDVGDVFKVKYSADLEFISSGCGFAHTFKIDTIITTFNEIDSIAVVSPEVNTIDGTNVKIYF